MASFALWCCVFGLVPLRSGLVADTQVVRITNFWGRSRRIPWSDLQDIECEQAPMAPGYYRLVFISKQGRRTFYDGMKGRPEPGDRLFEVRQDLLGMRQAYGTRP